MQDLRALKVRADEVDGQTDYYEAQTNTIEWVQAYATIAIAERLDAILNWAEAITDGKNVQIHIMED